MTRYPEIFNRLSAPFAPGDVKERPGGGGRKLTYITARTAMNRLDDVLGPENWSDEYYEVCDVLFCRLTITLPDGSTVTKSDSGGFKEMQEKDRTTGKMVVDEENTDKTGSSDAFKRAAVKFGVGRYLYGDGQVQHTAPAPPKSKTAAPMAFGPWIAKTSEAIGCNEYQVLNHLWKWSHANGWLDRHPANPGAVSNRDKYLILGPIFEAEREHFRAECREYKARLEQASDNGSDRVLLPDELEETEAGVRG